MGLIGSDDVPPLSERQGAVPLAATMQAAARARALRAQGRDVISLTLGEPDFPSPPHAVEAAHLAALRGETRYPPLTGTPALKAAVRRKFQRDSGLVFTDDEVLVGHGARQIIYDALLATLDPGSEVVVPAPYWNAYPLIARAACGVPVFVDCHAADGFLPQPDAIARAITPRTRWLVLNYPNNPTGAVCPAAHLAAIAAVMRQAPHVWIMSDDMYEQLVHDGSANPTMAAVAPDLAGRVLTVSGVSKTYAMTGWRVGFAGGERRLIEAMARIQGNATGGVSPMAQAAAASALDGPQAQVAAMRDAFAARCGMMAALLNAVPGVACAMPAGAFYVFPSVADLLGRRSPAGRPLVDDAAFCSALLEEGEVASVHGAAFGKSGHVRFSAASDEALLAEACRRVADFCAALRP